MGTISGSLSLDALVAGIMRTMRDDPTADHVTFTEAEIKAMLNQNEYAPAAFMALFYGDAAQEATDD